MRIAHCAISTFSVIKSFHLNLFTDQMSIGQKLLFPLVANIGDTLCLTDKKTPAKRPDENRDMRRVLRIFKA